MPVPLKSDRSVWDMDYPEKHASDIEEEVYTYHLPPPTTEGYVPVVSSGHWVLAPASSGTSSGVTPGTVNNHNDLSGLQGGTVNEYYHLPAPSDDGMVAVVSGGSWTVGQIATPDISRQTILTFAGDLEVCDNPLRIYNRLGVSQTISEIFLSVGTAPIGAGITVDIHKNGTTIFTSQVERPGIEEEKYTGYTTTIDVPTWADGEYLTAHIDQIGSTVAGSDLVVHIIHR